MAEITSELLEVTVDTDHTVEIDSKLPEVVVDITKSITAEIQPDTYVLTSGGMYTGNMTGAVPTWILNAIQQQLTTGEGNLMSVLDDIQQLLDGLQLGVNQSISQIENTNLSMSALETSLASRIDDSQAAILDIYATKVTPTEAQAIAVQAIGATFNGNVDAYIGNLASVYTDADSATATNIRTLQASYNDQTARIDTVEEVAVSAARIIRSATAPTIITHPTLTSGWYWIDTGNNNIEYVWNGTSWDQTTTGSAEQAVVWSANASKLITAPDGSVTGWSFGDGSNTKSEFKIQAEKFSISDGTTGYTPFSIVGSNIKFNGTVSFTNVTNAPTIPDSTSDLVNDSGFINLATVAAQGYVLPAGVANAINTNTTTINGAKITTGTIAAAQIAANTITADKIASNTITAAQISSSYVYAGTLNATNITAGTLNVDRITSGSLTSASVVTGSAVVISTQTYNFTLVSASTVAGVVTDVRINVSVKGTYYQGSDTTYYLYKGASLVVSSTSPSFSYTDMSGAAATYTVKASDNALYQECGGCTTTYTATISAITFKK